MYLLGYADLKKENGYNASKSLQHLSKKYPDSFLKLIAQCNDTHVIESHIILGDFGHIDRHKLTSGCDYEHNWILMTANK